MRINQSSNWRALAVLGALLSVIIVWPTVLSMPMLTARKSTTTNENDSSLSTTSSALGVFLTNLTSTNVTTVESSNNIQTDVNDVKNSNYSEYSDYGNYLFQLNANTSDTSEDQVDDHDTNEYVTNDRVDIDPLYRSIMTSFDDTDSSNQSNTDFSRRVKKSNRSSMNNSQRSKRRKKINGNGDEVSAEDNVSNTTYLSSASISESRLRNFSNNNDSVSVSQSSDVSNISHHYQSKRTRNSYKSDTSDRSHNSDRSDISDRNDDNDGGSDVTSTSNRRWKYLLTTTLSYDIDVTSELWNNEESVDGNDNSDSSDIIPTSATGATFKITTPSIATVTESATQTHTEYPVLSRTDRSVHMKRGITDRQQRGKINNGGTAAVNGEGAGGSIKSRRLHIHNKNHNYRNNDHTNSNSSNLDRNERSTLMHSKSGPGRKIQLYIKNRFIQLMPDGTVNGTQDHQSDYTILQRTTVDVAQIKIQGVATCLYLCMDQCGAVYGSKEFSDDCVFNESMEQHNYNTYSSTYNSNSRRTYYLALNRHGEPRKLQIPSSRSLGKLATYTKAITETVTQDRVEALIAKNFGANRVKHGIRQLCDTGKPLVELTDKIIKPRPQCTAANSNSNSNSNTSNKNGQLNVPAANDKSRLSNSNSNSNLTNSISRNSSSSSTSSNNNNSSSSTSSSSSNGHTSGNSNNNHLIKKKKKRRRCRPGENEDEHNCQRSGPQAMKKRPANGNGNKTPKCKDIATDPAVECTNVKRPKKGGKNKHANGGGGGGGGQKHNGGAKQNGDGKNGGGSGSANAEGGRRGGKKLNQNGRQQQRGGNSNNNNNSNKKKNNGKQPKNGLGGGGRTTTTTTTTTIHPIATNNKIARTPRSRSAPSTTTTTTTTSTAETTTPTMVTSPTASVSSQVTTFVNNRDGTMDQISGESLNADELDEEDHSFEEETAEADDDDDEMAPNDDEQNLHTAYASENTKLTSEAADFGVDFDSIPLGLWEIVLVVWITKWFL